MRLTLEKKTIFGFILVAILVIITGFLAYQATTSEVSAQTALLTFSFLSLLSLGLLAGIYFVIRRDLKARKQSDKVFKELLESAPDAMVIVNSGGEIVLVNVQTQKLFGYSTSELVGQSVEILIPQRFSNVHSRHRGNFFADPRVRPMGVGMELYGRRKDGGEFPVEISLSPLETADGVLVSSAIRDITARKQVEATIYALNLELEERIIERTAQLTQLAAVNKELEAFSYSISHDLRAPLRALDGLSQAVIEDYADRLDQDGVYYLGRIRAASQRMGQLIDDLLSLSQFTRMEMRSEKVDLSALAHEITVELQEAYPERKVQIVIENDLIAKGDARLLRVMLVNLLGNAWKFSAKQAHARIEFGRTERNGQKVYVVRDNGAGFDMAYAHKLFGAFQRLHGIHEFEGTGIGLATVQRIVHRHGGQIWAEGAIDQGAAFYFVI